MNGLVVLNAEDFYSALVIASQNYFRSLHQIQGFKTRSFYAPCDKEGGGIQSFSVERCTEWERQPQPRVRTDPPVRSFFFRASVAAGRST